jgi:hypothetical protein
MMSSWWEAEIDDDIAEILIEFNFSLSGKKIHRDWRKDCDISYENLEDDLETAPSIMAFWSAVLAEARKKLKTLELKVDIQRAKVMKSIRPPEGVKLTVADKESIIILDAEYGGLLAQKIQLESTVSKLFGIVDSIKMKADNLSSLAGFKRAELNGS